MKLLVWVGGMLPFLNGMLSYDISVVETGILKLRDSAETRMRVLDKVKNLLFVFGELFVWLGKFLASHQSHFLWNTFSYSSIVSHPASDLSAILINLFLYFSLWLIDVKNGVILCHCFPHDE